MGKNRERERDREAVKKTKRKHTCLIVSASSASPCSNWSLTSATSFLLASSTRLPPSEGLVGRMDQINILLL